MGQAIAHFAARFDIALLTLRADGENPVEEELVRSCVLVEEIARRRVVRAPHRLWRERRRLLLTARRRPPGAVGYAVSALRQRLDALVHEWQPDVVQLEYLVLADLVSAISAPRPPVVLVDYDARPFVVRGLGKRWRALRRDAARNVDAIVAFTDADARAVREDVDAARIAVIPPGFDLPPPAGVGGGADVLFVGGSHHPPNVDAVLRLVNEIYPRVRQLRPEATLTIVGGEVPRLVAPHGVRITGLVPDVRPYIERAAVVVAPLREGGGIRIKVLETLATGKALVASSRALEGIEVRSGTHVLVAETDDEIAGAIAALLGDVELRRTVGAAARAWAETNLSWSLTMDRYERLYDELERR